MTSSSEAILTISIYNKVPWGPSYVSRVCQHAYLASQALQDVYDALPCIFSASGSSTAGNPAVMKPGCAFYIEKVLYCDSPEYSKYVWVAGWNVTIDAYDVSGKYLNTSLLRRGRR